jgi:p-cumate 2,3-dioxygenase subunit beta
MSAAISRSELEAFLVDEATLLDEWRLDAWLQLLTEDAHYLVPALDKPGADHRKSLFLIADDMRTLKSRIAQLQGRTVWAENPKSRTRRLVTNFRVLETEGEQTRVTANFAVWRFQLDATDVYVGRYEHLLVRDAAGALRFKERKALLDLETLRPHGKLSFIL